MWPVIAAAIRTYAPYITLPFAAIIGFIGYNAEWTIRGNNKEDKTIKTKSIQEEREERLLAEMKERDPLEVESLKSKPGVPKTVLDRNDKSKILKKLSDAS